ncbi:MAG: RNA methyltransferase [Muribaculaceae bacterium]|nr:RNA methyltransferase [Muribaculaceae bacterium]
MNETFEMVAKTFQGLEDVLAEELRDLGAINVEPGRRMVAFEGDLAMLYKANLCCRTALRILKPIYKFTATDTDTLYDAVKEFDWSTVLSIDKTFSIDTVAYSDEFTHSQFVTYRVKDAIVDWFRDRFGSDKRPGVRLQDADVMINVHIAGDRVTLSLDSSGESLHKRGYRVAQTEAPINEVLAAGIILRSGWRGDCPLVDPMCGSGTFLVEAALIAANINPGIYRKGFAFENWKNFDAELFDSLYNDDSREREFNYKIYGADISPKAVDIAMRNIKSAGVARYIDLQVKPLSQWISAPANGVLITNPPYGERISADDMEGLYEMIGNKLKNVFKGYHAWIIGYRKEYFDMIHLSASTKLPILNGALECELREYEIFEGDYKSFRQAGGKIHHGESQPKGRDRGDRGDRKPGPRKFRDDRRRAANADGDEARYSSPRNKLEERYASRGGGFNRRDRYGRDKSDRYERDNDRRDRFSRDDRGFDRRGRDSFGKRRFDDDRREAPAESENPLAVRRNEAALRSITGRQPSLAKPGVKMRPRNNGNNK